MVNVYSRKIEASLRNGHIIGRFLVDSRIMELSPSSTNPTIQNPGTTSPQKVKVN